MSLSDGFRSINQGFRSIFDPMSAFDTDYRRTTIPPRCVSWYGHRYVYADKQIICVNCGHNVSTKNLKTSVHPCTAWNGHLYARLPADAVESDLKFKYCVTCLAVYAQET